MADPRDIQRLVGDLAQYGTVIERDGALCRVQLGEIETPLIPWLAGRAGGARIWSPPSIGEQVLVLSPEADFANGLVLLGVFSDANPAPADDDATLIQFEDGTRLRYDSATSELSIVVATGSIEIEAPELRIVGNLSIEGDVELTGKMTASDDVVAAGKSLKGHKHLQVQPGSGVSGSPQ